MMNAKNARPFGKRRDQPTKPTTLPDGWTLGRCIMAGAGDNEYDLWEITDDKGQRDAVFTKRNKP